MFNAHIETIAQATFKALGFVLRNGREFDAAETLRHLYRAFVRSHLEYASVVWSSLYNGYISALERIQRRFLKSVAFIVDEVYLVIGSKTCFLTG